MSRKVALVTGGSRGIGRGITEALARKGWTIAVNFHRNKEAAEAAVEKAVNLGGEAFPIQADISALERVSLVMIGGQLVKRPGENSSLAGLLPRPADSETQH